MTAKIFSATIKGCQAILVAINVNCENGSGISISGLLTQTIYRDLSRLQLALINCGFGIKGKKLHIELEPAVYENGEEIMLAIAVAILMATEKIPRCTIPKNYLIAGGLGVTGNIHQIDNAVSIASMGQAKGFQKIILPISNIKSLSIVYAKEIYAARDLISLVRFLKQSQMRKIQLPSGLLEHLNFN